MAYRNYSTANGVLVDQKGNGDYTTISAAIAAAVSGQTIFVRDGTYTENWSGKPGVTVTAFTGDASEPNVIFHGTISYSSAGTFTVANCKLVTNNAPCVFVSGSVASQFNIVNCFVNALNNTAISFTSISSGASIILDNCQGDIGLGGIQLHSSTSPGNIEYFFCTFTNTGNSTLAANNSAGSCLLQESQMQNAFSTSDTGGFTYSYSSITTSTMNITGLTLNGTGNSAASFSTTASGSASAISVGVGATLDCVSNQVTSSNTNAVTGLGTIKYTPFSFKGTSSTVNTSTQILLPFGPQLFAPTGITFDNTNVLANYVTGGNFSWTLVGGSVAGTTTYTAQQGYYTRLGNVINAYGILAGSAATGTGNAVVGGLPFPVKNQTNGIPPGTLISQSAAGWTWPASTTMLSFIPTPSNSTGTIYGSGSGTTGGNLQMANAAFTFYINVTYQI